MSKKIREKPANTPHRRRWASLSVELKVAIIGLLGVTFTAIITLVTPLVEQWSKSMFQASTITASPAPILTSTIQAVATVVVPSTTTLEPVDLKVAQVLVADYGENARIEITLYNPARRTLLVKSIQLIGSFRIGYSDPPPPFYEITISSEAKASIHGNDKTELIFMTAQGAVNEAKEYVYPATGTIVENTFGETADVLIATSFLIPEQEYSVFYITVPKQQAVINSKVEGSDQRVGDITEVDFERFATIVRDGLQIRMTLDTGGQDVEVRWPR